MKSPRVSMSKFLEKTVMSPRSIRFGLKDDEHSLYLSTDSLDLHDFSSSSSDSDSSSEGENYWLDHWVVDENEEENREQWKSQETRRVQVKQREKQEKKKAKKAFEDAYKEELVMQLALKESAGYNHKSINSRCNDVGQSGTRRYVQSKKGTPIPMIEALIKKKLTPEEIAKERERDTTNMAKDKEIRDKDSKGGLSGEKEAKACSSRSLSKWKMKINIKQGKENEEDKEYKVKGLQEKGEWFLNPEKKSHSDQQVYTTRESNETDLTRPRSNSHEGKSLPGSETEICTLNCSTSHNSSSAKSTQGHSPIRIGSLRSNLQLNIKKAPICNETEEMENLPTNDKACYAPDSVIAPADTSVCSRPGSAGQSQRSRAESASNLHFTTKANSCPTDLTDKKRSFSIGSSSAQITKPIPEGEVIGMTGLSSPRGGTSTMNMRSWEEDSEARLKMREKLRDLKKNFYEQPPLSSPRGSNTTIFANSSFQDSESAALDAPSSDSVVNKDRDKNV